jgi:glycine/serine hydroxymethyltransferase
MLYGPLAEVDPEVHSLIVRETERQFKGLELIASEVWRHDDGAPYCVELYICCRDGG